MDKYKVIRPYTTYCFGFPMTIPVGSIGEWFENSRCYTFDTIHLDGQGYVPFVRKWPVEAWHEYFEKVTE